jgi:hypothetical protein
VAAAAAARGAKPATHARAEATKAAGSAGDSDAKAADGPPVAWGVPVPGAGVQNLRRAVNRASGQ